VAIATVSRALSKPGRVNAETRERILAAAQRLGYTTNIAARSLRSGSSRIVLVIMPPWEGFRHEGVLRGIDAALTKAGYSMIVTALDRERAALPVSLKPRAGLCRWHSCGHQ
jgi:DNA-binding LacI/PurR family transcriptional regulator